MTSYELKSLKQIIKDYKQSMEQAINGKWDYMTNPEGFHDLKDAATEAYILIKRIKINHVRNA